MNLRMLIEELSSMPKDKLLYDSINQPTWHMSQTGEVVLAGSPCPIQTVEQLLHKLKLIQKRDLPSQDFSFKRAVHEDIEIYTISAKPVNGVNKLRTELITSSTVKLWQMFSTDHMLVDVAVGGPSYLMSSDKVKILVNKPYYQILGLNGKRTYLEELLSVHSFSWQDEKGQIQFFNKSYWDNSSHDCHCDDAPVLDINNNAGGFNTIHPSKGKHTCQ